MAHSQALGGSDSRSREVWYNRAMKRIISLAAVLALFSGCRFIMGSDKPSESGIRLVFVETLRNAASLFGGAFKEIENSTNPADTLQRPNAVYADQFRVYVVDAYLYTPSSPGAAPGARIFVFERGERTVKILDSSSGMRLISPTGIAVDGANIIFVTDSQTGKVFGYDKSGTPVLELGKAGEFASPIGIAVDRFRNRIYIADSRGRKVWAYTTTGGRLFEIGPGTEGAGPLSPLGLCIDRRGDLYILDGSERRVLIYSPDGVLLRSFSISDGSGVGVRPRGIALDSDGHVYVMDMLNNSVLIFDNKGGFIQKWGRTGMLFGDFWTPTGIFIDDRDYIYIADQTNGRIQVFQYLK